jgi:hypothetical protein
MMRCSQLFKNLSLEENPDWFSKHPGIPEAER